MKLIYLFFFVVIFFLNIAYSSEDNKNKILKYLNGLNYFSASFIQSDGKNVSEGKVYIGEKRLRAEYFSPEKILIILDEDKAMYYNYELEEDEFFDPKNTNAWVLYDIFKNQLFFADASIKVNNNEIILAKVSFDEDENKYLIRVYFENNPLILRRVEFFVNQDFLQLSIFNHNYNETFDENLFKLINPNFFD